LVKLYLAISDVFAINSANKQSKYSLKGIYLALSAFKEAICDQQDVALAPNTLTNSGTGGASEHRSTKSH
jgi:hypothetical protein